MRLTPTPSERALQEEIRAFLAAEGARPARPAARAGRSHGRAARLAGALPRGRVRRPGVAERARGRRRPGRRADRHRPGARRRRRTRVRGCRRPRRARAVAAALRHRRAAPASHPGDPVGRGDLVPGVLGARGRLGSRVAAHARRRARRPLRRLRPEDVGLVGPVRAVVRRARAHRRRRAEAQGHLHADRRHARARRRAAADDPDHRPCRVLRAVPRRRRGAEGEPPRRPRRRLEDRDAHARPRARDRRASAPGQAPHVAGPRGTGRRRADASTARR